MSGLTDRLRQVAGQATPGPWAHDDGRPWVWNWVWNEELRVASGWREDEARFVATFDPVLVAAMLDVIDAAEGVECHRRSGRERMDFGPCRECGGCLTVAALARFREVSG